MAKRFTFLDFLVLEFSTSSVPRVGYRSANVLLPLAPGAAGRHEEGQLVTSNHKQPLLFIPT